MITRAWLMQRHGELEELRRKEERLLRKIAQLLRPDDDDFSGSDAQTDGTQPEVFDSTPLYAHSDFVAGLFGQAINPANRWYELGLEDQDLAKWKTVKDWLWASTSLTAQSLSPSVSSFYLEAPAWFADLGSFGLGVMSSEEAVGQGRIIDRAHAIRNCYIDLDEYGECTTVHTIEMVTGRNVLKRFPGTGGVREDQSRYKIIHACFPNPDFREGKMGPQGKRFLSVKFSPDIPDLFKTSGYYEFPYFVPMWSRRAGSVWPRGPGHLVHPDASTLQEFRRSELTAAAFAADPIRLISADADYRMSDFYPGNMLAGGMDLNGRPTVQALNMGGQLQISLDQSNQLRAAIKEAFHFSILQLINRPQMTATEVMAFDQEKLRLLAPSLVRIQAHGLTPLVARRFRLLERAGQLPPPPPELLNKPIAINYVSPLAKQQLVQQGRNVMNWIGALGQMAQVTGRSDVMDNLDLDDAAMVLHDAMGVPPSVLMDQKKRDQAREGRNQMQAQQMQLEQQGQQVKIAAEASHAAQAQSAASQRQA